MKSKYKKGGVFVLFGITLILVSCSKHKVGEEDLQSKHIIPIHDIPNLKLGRYSEVFEDISLVKLETTEESLIGRIDKLVYFKNRFYILDQVERKAVLVFDKGGKYITRIGANGGGPGEYDEPNDVVINRFTNEIIVYCNNKRTLLFYALDGRFERELMIDYYAKTIMPIGPDRFALYLDLDKESLNVSKNGNIVIVDDKGHLVKEQFMVDPELAVSRGGFSFFNNFGEELQVSPGYSNSIFVMGGDSLSKKYFIDFGPYSIPLSFHKKSSFDFKQELQKYDYAYLDRFSETPRHLFFTFVKKGKVYDCYYSKATKELKYGNLFLNDVHGVLTGVHMASYQDTIVGYVDPAAITSIQNLVRSSSDAGRAKSNLIKTLEAIKGMKSSVIEDVAATHFSYSEEEIVELHSIRPSDNPVLILGKLKSF